MAAILPQDLAQAINYGPQTAQAIRRSQYLTDALKANLDAGQNIHSPWELGSRLIAQAILNRSTDKAQLATIAAMKADQDAETEKMMGGLRPPAMPPATPPTAPTNGLVSQDTAPTHDPNQPIDIGVPPRPAPASTIGALSDADRLAIARAVSGEARGEPAAGQQAVAAVIMNRAKAGGLSPAAVVAQPHQFSGYNARSQALGPAQLAPIMANIDPVLSGQMPDPTGGADHFYNPALASPSWGAGAGQMIGQHKFMHLGDVGHAPSAQMTAGPPPQGPMQVAPSMAAAQAPQPYQVAANGQTPAPPMPSAPASSPPAAGGPPAAVPPQANAAGGSPPMRQVSQWPMWKPSDQEAAFVEGLLRDPRTHQQGVQAAIAMRQKMTQPVEATMQMVNGVPVYFGKDPTDGAVMVMPVPHEAMTQHADGAAAGLPAGAQMDVKPTGERNLVYKPPEGYQAAPGGGLQYQQGGPADPGRPQAPPQGYQYAAPPAGPGGAPGGAAPAHAVQTPIQGGPADPHAPMNVAEGTQRIQQNLRPIVDLAIVARQSYGAVGAGYKQQNGTGDIAMVNGLQHLIDKGVVRGEDVNMQMKSNGIAGGLGQVMQYINSDGLLTPEVRNKVMIAARDLYQNIDHQYRAQVMSHRATVDAVYGDGAFDKYVVPSEQTHALGWSGEPADAAPAHPAPAPQAHFTPGSMDAALAEAVRRGMPLNHAQQAHARQIGLIP